MIPSLFICGINLFIFRHFKKSILYMPLIFCLFSVYVSLSRFPDGSNSVSRLFTFSLTLDFTFSNQLFSQFQETNGLFPQHRHATASIILQSLSQTAFKALATADLHRSHLCPAYYSKLLFREPGLYSDIIFG